MSTCTWPTGVFALVYHPQKQMRKHGKWAVLVSLLSWAEEKEQGCIPSHVSYLEWAFLKSQFCALILIPHARPHIYTTMFLPSFI